MPCHPDKDDLNAWGMDGGMDKQKESEKDKESDAGDGFGVRSTNAADSHQKAADNHKYHTLGHQKKKPKARLVSTFGKGSPNTKSRGAPIHGLFNQGLPEKTPVQEERGSVGGQSQMEMLKQSLQTFSVPYELNWWWGEGNKSDALENSWTDIVHSHNLMPKTQRHQQEAMWEFLLTEFIYINKLTVITDLVLAALDHVHKQGFLHEITSAQLFSNIFSIRDAHRLFWQEVLYPMLQNVRLTGQPFDPLKLELGCLQFADRFSAYLDYCWEEERNLEFTRRQLDINPHFSIFLKWVETHPQCGRMRLGDMQAKPHQRITKYPLLLKAILKVTEDLDTQKKLNCMINSVSQFLDSINEYLLFKDDELALFVLSQRIEGYELQGMSEEIDKHMQEFCHFDLTSPIRGTGPKVIRKLLMEETLKVRGRKDSKLEVVVLLFTDVLLLTKSQKKSEKQKVVRPPLSLERIHCAELKDGYSFVLVEVSDLGCPVSVYSVSTSSPESCATWISTIHQAQEDLQTLRKIEKIKTEETSDQILGEPDPFHPEGILNIKDTEEQLEYKNQYASLGFTAIQLENEEQNNQHVPADVSSKQMQIGDKLFKNENSMREENERSKSGQNGHCDDSNIMNGPMIERRVTWNHKLQQYKNSNAFPQLLKTNTSSGSHLLLDGGLSESSALSQSSSGQVLLPPIESAVSITQQQSQQPDLRQDSWSHQSGDENESLSESGTFTRILNSPRLRRKRPINSQPPALPQGSRRMSADSISLLNPDIISNSVSDSDKDHNIGGLSSTSSKTQEHRVLKLGSIKQNQGVFWNVPTVRFSESESELTQESRGRNSQKIPKIKTQRSESLPGLKSSPLQGLLNRAKERERERGKAKREGKHLEKSSLQSSNTSPSPSPSQGKNEIAGANLSRQELIQSRSCDDFHPETATYVDRSSDDQKNRPVTPLGVNVAWAGWWFDDVDVLEFTELDDETEAWFKPNTAECRRTPRNSDTDYSEV